MNKKLNENNTKIEPNKAIKKPPLWFYIILFFIPIAFIAVLEISLIYFDYGYNFKLFIRGSEYNSDKNFTNPEISYKYFFNIKAVPSVMLDGFDRKKKDNAFRIFILGESSAAGWPYVPNASFSRQLKRKLELFYTENTIEVINMGISAINSFTLRDFAKDVINQQPDLVIIYAGHNEYYGALGVGSSISMGYSRDLINAYIWLRNFRTTQLIQNIISGVYEIFSSFKGIDSNGGNETLMGRMIGQSLIPLNSDIFDYGIQQFNGNMDNILKCFNENNIPVILSNLTCNLKDQKPFVSIKSEKNSSADQIFAEAKNEYETGNIKKSKELFFNAKELDALRFRAPQKINEVIYNLSKKYNLPVVNIDSIFQSNSVNGIVGASLMVDHLHPNIDGYRLMSNAYFNMMDKVKLLPTGKRNNITIQKADSILLANFPFTRIDSLVAQMGVNILTGSYPFVPKGTPNFKVLNFRAKDFVDSIAVKLINKEIKWESAYAELSDYYFGKGDYKNCIRELNTVIAERPDYDLPYKDLITKLVDRGILDDALRFLKQLYKVKADYFSTKWLGQVLLKQNNYKEALPYLKLAVNFREVDFQTWYNLGGAYFLNGDKNSSLRAIEKSLRMNPNNPSAIQFYKQLKTLRN
jgi:tetratricopeptide (TPR) repeat protein